MIQVTKASTNEAGSGDRDHTIRVPNRTHITRTTNMVTRVEVPASMACNNLGAHLRATHRTRGTRSSILINLSTRASNPIRRGQEGPTVSLIVIVSKAATRVVATAIIVLAMNRYKKVEETRAKLIHALISAVQVATIALAPLEAGR